MVAREDVSEQSSPVFRRPAEPAAVEKDFGSRGVRSNREGAVVSRRGRDELRGEMEHDFVNSEVALFSRIRDENGDERVFPVLDREHPALQDFAVDQLGPR